MTVDSVVRMGRPPAYTEEQDSIILANRSYDAVMARFAEAGYEGQWTPGQITARRGYLKKQGHAAVGTGRDEQTLVVLLGRRRELEVARAKLRRSLTEVEEEMANVNANIHGMASAIIETTDTNESVNLG